MVLSYDFWQKQFGGDRNVLGRTLELDRRAHNIIGVMPAGFQFPNQADPVEFYVTLRRTRRMLMAHGRRRSSGVITAKCEGGDREIHDEPPKQ